MFFLDIFLDFGYNITIKEKARTKMPKFHLDKSFIKNPIRFNDIYLVQIGRLYFEPGDNMHLHSHKSFFELTIITDGEGEVITNGIPAPVKRGDIYLSLPRDMHEIRSSVNAPMKYDFYSFYTENEEYASALDSATSYLSPEERVFTDERIGALVCDAIMEFIERKKFSEDLLYSIFKQIMIYIIRNIKSGNHKRSRSASAAESLCYKIMNYIDTHVYTIRSLEEVAEALNYNYSYLSSLFKSTTGNTLFSYYESKRLDLARELLSDGTQSVTEIADLLGYSSLYSFSRAFKENFGKSPKKYMMTRSGKDS